MDLRPPGDACLRSESPVVASDVLAEVLDVAGALRSRPDETHLTLEDVQELRQLVQRPLAEEGADRRPPILALHSSGCDLWVEALLARLVRGGLSHRAELELRDMIEEVDADKSGTIDFEEFKMLMVSQQGDRQSRLKMSFSVFDENGTGQISKNEMQDVMSRLG